MLHRHLAAGLTMALALLVASCKTPPQSTPTSLAIPIARLQTSDVAILTGQVRAPLGMAPAPRVLAMEEAPLAGATVRLAELDGVPLPEVAPVVTDQIGYFRFDGVPVGRTLMVVVEVLAPDGTRSRLMTLVTTRNAELRADVSAGTTVLTAATLRRTGWDTGAIDPVAFLEEATLIDQALTASDVLRLEDPGLLPTATPTPTPSPTPRRSGGGGSGGGGSRPPTTGNLQTEISIQDGPFMALSPTPTPTP